MAARVGSVVLLALLTLGACTSDDPQASTTSVSPPVSVPGGIPVHGESIGGPGTQIASGYRVVEGSYLVGRAIPLDAVNGQPATSWTALAIVTGDPDAVLDGYAQQAKAEGLDVSLDPDGLGPDHCAGLGQDPTAEECVVTLSAADYGISKALQIIYARGIVDGQPTSLIRIERHERFNNDLRGDRSLPRPDLPEHLDLPRHWPALPRVGDALTPPLGPGRLRVVPGTAPVAPAWRLGPFPCTVQLAWIIRVNDDTDPRQAFKRYLSQYDVHPEDLSPYEVTLADGTYVQFEPSTSVTQWDLDLTLVQPRHGTSWIFIDHCNMAGFSTESTSSTTPPTTARPPSTTSPDQAKVDAAERNFRSYAAGSDLLDNVTGFESFAGGSGVQIDTNLLPNAATRALSGMWCNLARRWLATFGQELEVIGIRVATSDGQRIALTQGTSGCEQADF